MFGLFESDEQKADKACAKGCWAFLRGEYGDSIEYFKKAVGLNPNHYEAWNNFGVVLCLNSNALQEAKKCFEKALAVKSDYRNAIRGLAIVEKGLGNEENALRLFQRLVDEFRYNPCEDTTLDDSLFKWMCKHDELFRNAVS